MSLAKRKSYKELARVKLAIVPRECPDCHGILFEYRERIRTSTRGYMLAQEWVCWRDGYYDASNFPLLTEEQRELSKNMFRNNHGVGLITETLFKKTLRVYPPFEPEVLKKEFLPSHLRKNE